MPSDRGNSQWTGRSWSAASRRWPGWYGGEFKIRGTRAEGDPDIQARYAAAVGASLGWTPEPGRFHLFAVTISQVRGAV